MDPGDLMNPMNPLSPISPFNPLNWPDPAPAGPAPIPPPADPPAFLAWLIGGMLVFIIAIMAAIAWKENR